MISKKKKPVMGIHDFLGITLLGIFSVIWELVRIVNWVVANWGDLLKLKLFAVFFHGKKDT